MSQISFILHQTFLLRVPAYSEESDEKKKIPPKESSLFEKMVPRSLQWGCARRLVVLGAEVPMELAEIKPGGKGEKGEIKNCTVLADASQVLQPRCAMTLQYSQPGAS